jgi:hypothetical protein
VAGQGQDAIVSAISCVLFIFKFFLFFSCGVFLKVLYHVEEYPSISSLLNFCVLQGFKILSKAFA